MTYDTIERHGDYTISRKTYTRTDPRLGRNVRHDSRSLNYQVQAKDISTLKSVRHERHIPVLNQGDLGSCTGNAGTGAVGTAMFWDTKGNGILTADANQDEQYAVLLYSDATKVDPYAGEYPPTDTGSDGLSIAQVLQSRGVISGYKHATSLEAALTAIEETPCIAGIEWREDMFNPDPDGRIHITGAVAGGHEIVFDELDVENKRVWFPNSWGESWGVHGRAYLTWDDFGTLLAAQGDLTQFVVVEVSPEPQPEPTPEPTPEPEPTPAPVPDAPKDTVQHLVKRIKWLLNKLEEELNA